MKFHVGQKITGNFGSYKHYAYTNGDAIMEVVSISMDGSISVKIIEDKIHPLMVGSQHKVNPLYFYPVYKTAKFI